MHYIRARQIVLVLGGLCTAGIVIYGMPKGPDLELVAISLGILAWTLSPYMALWFTGRADDPVHVQILFLAGAMLVAADGLHSYHYMLFETADAQGGLVFLIEPVLQLAGIGLLGLAAMPLRARLRRH